MAEKDKVKSVGTVNKVRVHIWVSVIFDLWCENVMSTVLLPEWSDNVDVHSCPSMQFEMTTIGNLTSLALTGKDTVTLRARMLHS